MSLLSASTVIYKLDAALLQSLISSFQIASKKIVSNRDVVIFTIINNGTESAELEKLVSSYPDNDFFKIKIINNQKNIGYGGAQNLAIYSSKAKYHLIVNPDVILDPDSLVEGISYLDINPGVCAVSPEGRDENGEKLYLAKKYPSVFVLFLRAFCLNSKTPKVRKLLNDYQLYKIVAQSKSAPVKIISGCFMLCRSNILKKIGGFDNRYFLYFEDFALSLELGKHGEIHYLPIMKIIHFGGNASKKGVRHILYFIRSGIRFFNTYGWKFM